jgi:hypothetical protein
MRTDKPTIIRAVHANRGIEIKYRRSIQKLIADLAGSVEYWLAAAYRKRPPLLAQDESPSEFMASKIEGLKSHWSRMFEELGSSIAEHYVTKLYKASDSAFRAALKDAGWSIEFKMTPAMRDAFNASLNENVGLIKSIPQQYLQEVEGTVMRGYSAGRDLETIVRELKALYPKAAGRAELIARDQSNKANAVVNRARQMELGITDAIWMHSHAGKVPRPDHVAANGKQYKVAEGCLISGKLIQPGELINCFPGDALINLVNGCHEIWRYNYRGDILSFEAGSSIIRSTPNHPFLSDKGWIGAQFLNNGDYVWKAWSKEFNSGMVEVNDSHFMISDVFLAASSISAVSVFDGIFNFHGDIPDSEVESVRPTFSLCDKSDIVSKERGFKLGLTGPDTIRINKGIGRSQITGSLISCGGRYLSSPRTGKILESQDIGITAGSCLDSVFAESPCDKSSGDIEMFCDAQDTFPFVEHSNDVVIRKIIEILYRRKVSLHHCAHNDLFANSESSGNSRDTYPPAIEVNSLGSVNTDSFRRGSPLHRDDFKSPSSELLAQLVRVNAEMGRETFEAGEFIFDRVRVCNIGISKNFSDHVYTLQSDNGWYCTSTENIVNQNCRCTSRAVLPF